MQNTSEDLSLQSDSIEERVRVQPTSAGAQVSHEPAKQRSMRESAGLEREQIKECREAYMQELMAREAAWAKNAIKDEVYTVPNGEKKILLHSCCAPCSGPLIEKMHESGLELTIFFYNPNIHPLKEYEIRKNENIRYAEKLGIPFIDADYDVQDWFARAKGMEREPERGIRCTMCFDMRFIRTALYAHEHGFKVTTSSLGISRWKNMDQINDCGLRAAEPYPDVTYWTYNWRKDGGGARMYDLAKEEEFYAQQYCGCIFSLRDTNEWRESKGREKIAIGETWYEKKLSESD